MTENTFPMLSRGKYIPLVKQTSWTIILPTPPDAFSLTRLPINKPKAIYKMEITKDTQMAKRMCTVNFSPSKMAARKNRVSCMRIMGSKETM